MMPPSVSKRGKYYIVRDGSSEYSVDSTNGAISEKSRSNVTKADCKIVMVATSRTSPGLREKIMKRYYHLFS
jgi:hypothetical protein